MAANDVPCCETMFWVYLVISVALVAFAGLMSGLTLGLMSLSVLDLEVLAKAGQPNDKKNAAKILPVVKNQHLLLCTLLICNAMAMEALPVFLDSLLLEWCSILISVTLILTFGEIIPQAVCSRYGLSVGAKLSVFVRVLVIVVFPIAYPISKLLDLILGKGHSVLLRRAELKTYVDMHGNEAGKGGELTNDETTIIKGALDLTQMTAKDALTPVSEIFSLDLNSKLTEEAMSLILRKGHSRVPVYSGKPENIIGIILVKNLIKCRPEDETPIKNLTIRKIPRIHDCLPLYEILNLFQKGHCPMAVVVKSKSNLNNVPENVTVKIDINLNSQHCQAEQREIDYQNASSVTSSDTDTRSPTSNGKIRNDVLESFSNSEDEEIVGLITMNDVLEQLLQEPIFDETDDYVDIHNNIQVNMLPSMKPSLLRSPGTTSGSKYFSCRNLAISPISSSASCTSISSYHLTPVLRSPLSPFIQSPIMRPTLSASPRYSTPNSPAGHISSSPSSHRVSRKTYEKLQKPGDI